MKNLSMSGILLLSDLDGTLVPDTGVIPERNISAIERFISKGGRFAFATGRSVLGTEKYAAKVTQNAPSIVYNGGGIYDFGTRTLLWSKNLPRSYTAIVREVRGAFPDVGIEIYSGGNVYYLNVNEYTKAHIAFQGISAEEIASNDELPDSNKVLFCGEQTRIEALARHMEKIEIKGCAFVSSAPTYFEVLPEEVSKGAAAKILADILGIEHDKIMSIGDYYNDVELLEASAIAAVPAGAPDELKRIADVVVGESESGAVAEFIELLEDRFGI